MKDGEGLTAHLDPSPVTNHTLVQACLLTQTGLQEVMVIYPERPMTTSSEVPTS